MNGPIGNLRRLYSVLSRMHEILNVIEQVLLGGPGALRNLELFAGTGKRFLQALTAQLQFPAACVRKLQEAASLPSLSN